MAYSDENGVFFNKLGITDEKALAGAEYQITARKAAAWPLQECKTPFNLRRLKETHQFLFEDVYDWAGKVRTVPSKKRHPGGTGLSTFEAPEKIVLAWAALESKIILFQQSYVSQSDQINELTAIFIEANRIHPFPEGNGRSLQLFMKEFGASLNIDLDFSRVDTIRWNDACAVSAPYEKLYERGLVKIPSAGDTAPIKKVFSDIAIEKQSSLRDSEL